MLLELLLRRDLLPDEVEDIDPDLALEVGLPT